MIYRLLQIVLTSDNTHTHILHGTVVKTMIPVELRSYRSQVEVPPCRGYSVILWISLLEWIPDLERGSSTD